MTIVRAARRLAAQAPRRRADAGRARVARAVVDELRSLLLGQERPRIKDVRDQLCRFCRERGHRCPSRATIYNLMGQLEGQLYMPAELPEHVRAALYNLGAEVPVPGHQLAYYCFHYGDLRALSFAAGLPWLSLYQAARMPGWRPRTRGLLDAVLRARGLS